MVNQRVGNLRRERETRSSFKYTAPSPEYVKRQAERKISRFDSIFKDTFTMWRAKDGENAIRILPATWDDHQDYAYTIFLHRYVGTEKSNYLCLRKMLNKPCPWCNEAAAAKKANEADEARALQWGEGKVVWLLDRAEERAEPQLYLMPTTLYKDINALAYNNRTGAALFIDHPDEGYDVLIRRTGTQLSTRYLPQIEREPSPISGSSKEQNKILDFLEANPIPNCLEFKDYGYLERLISGTAEAVDEDLDGEDEDEPRARVGNKKPAAKVKARDEDDEDDQSNGETELWDDEPEEEERPRSKKKAMTRDLDEDEQEEREARASKKAKAKSRDEEEDYPDEDEPRPKKKPAAKVKARDEDDEDDLGEPEGQEDDQEEDDAPPRRQSRSSMPSGESRRVGSGRRQFRD